MSDPPEDAIRAFFRRRLSRFGTEAERLSLDDLSKEVNLLQGLQRLIEQIPQAAPVQRSRLSWEVLAATAALATIAIAAALPVQSEVDVSLSTTQLSFEMATTGVLTDPISAPAITVSSTDGNPLALDHPMVDGIDAVVQAKPIRIHFRVTSPSDRLTLSSVPVQADTHIEVARSGDEVSVTVEPNGAKCVATEAATVIDAQGLIDVEADDGLGGIQRTTVHVGDVKPFTVIHGCRAVRFGLHDTVGATTLIPSAPIRDPRMMEQHDRFVGAQPIRQTMSAIAGGTFNNLSIGDTYQLHAREVLRLDGFEGQLRQVTTSKLGLDLVLNGVADSVFVGSSDSPRNITPSLLAWGRAYKPLLIIYGSATALLGAAFAVVRWLRQNASG